MAVLSLYHRPSRCYDSTAAAFVFSFYDYAERCKSVSFAIITKNMN